MMDDDLWWSMTITFVEDNENDHDGFDKENEGDSLKILIDMTVFWQNSKRLFHYLTKMEMAV